MLEEHQLAGVDILGGPLSGHEDFAGRTLLAEFLFHGLPEKEQKSPLGEAADTAENDAPLGVADDPGFSLRDVEVRLAYAYRLLLWGGQARNGPYPEAATRMVAASLSDVVLMRTAERARPRVPDAAEPGPVQERVAPPEPEPSVPQVLVQMKDLLREMTLLFQEQQQELRRLHDQRKGVTA
jgi:hypothetical protein